MKKDRPQIGEYFSLEDLLLVMRQELDDAREEHNRLSELLVRYDEDDDDDSYKLENYVDDLQEYIDDMEDLTDNIDRLIDVRSRMSDDMEQLNVQDVFNSFGAMLGEDISTYADLLKIDNEHNLDGVSIFTHLNDKYSEYIKEKEARKKARQ